GPCTVVVTVYSVAGFIRVLDVQVCPSTCPRTSCPPAPTTVTSPRSPRSTRTVIVSSGITSVAPPAGSTVICASGGVVGVEDEPDRDDDSDEPGVLVQPVRTSATSRPRTVADRGPLTNSLTPVGTGDAPC